MGKWEGTERLDLLGAVGHDHHPLGGLRHDFFPQQRSSSTFDEMERRVKLVGSINDDVKSIDIVQGHQRDALFFGQCSGGQGRRDAHDVQPLIPNTPTEFKDGVLHG